MMDRICLHLLSLSGFLSLTLCKPHGYVLIREAMSWGEAQNYCRENHIDLATVQSVEDWTTLQEVADEEKFSSFAWIGLYNDINSWRWSYQEESVVFKSWYSDQPDNSGTGDECAGIYYTGSWFDYYCSDTRPFVCSDESTNATEKMVVIKTLKPWLDAQKYCRENYTDLATVRSRSDNNQIVSLIKNLNGPNPWINPWIGLYRDSWKWSDQANFTSSTQLTAKRINTKGKNCAGAIYDSTSINADFCSGLHYFYCSIGGADETQELPHQADERDPQLHQGAEALHLGNLLQGEDPGDPTEGAERAEENSLPQHSVHHGLDQRAFHVKSKQQVIRVQVNASEDADDATLTALVSHKLQQMLSDQDVTLTWRKQPNGKIFQKKKTSNASTPVC